jgi:uncharacterized Ntn-hydrolase superfamily protein
MGTGYTPLDNSLVNFNMASLASNGVVHINTGNFSNPAIRNMNGHLYMGPGFFKLKEKDGKNICKCWTGRSYFQQPKKLVARNRMCGRFSLLSIRTGMKLLSKLCFICFSGVTSIMAQDTFSIVAVDSTSREVGSAGASCVDLFIAGISDVSFLGDLLPDSGAINTQSYYLEANQDNARARMRAGDSATEIINWLAKHDVDDNPTLRQYGVASLDGMAPDAAGYTGINCIDYKNHITGHVDGFYYAIQGNILLDAEVLNSMEHNFRSSTGDLACRLMAAMQGANRPGADSRCSGNGTSSLFAYLKVAQPTDSYGNPSLSVGMRTRSGTGIEPIDSLQVLFDNARECIISGAGPTPKEIEFSLTPNPAGNEIVIQAGMSHIVLPFTILDATGRVALTGSITSSPERIDIHSLTPGHYLFQLDRRASKPFIKSN